MPRKAASPRSTNSALVAWVVFALSSYRIYIATFSLRIESTSNVYDAGYFPIYTQRPQKVLDSDIASYPRKAPMLSNVRTLDESRLPLQCGMIFFYHIACTGGASINRWLGKEKNINKNVQYYTHWGRNRSGVVQATFIKGMESQVKNIRPGEWRIVHAHGLSLHLNTSELYLYKWREEVESQGCGFVATTMLRDAVGHTISQQKGIYLFNKTVDEFANGDVMFIDAVKHIYYGHLDYLLS
ncbi:hypothetical protein ACHAXA_005169 [Cyclostephanos tholiformis]|uniref:Uncharacterized protein n=1 Tax=Cyclostephanos tholiformis TaxID=382380 RepID=A0ABD3R7J3_9STRA